MTDRLTAAILVIGDEILSGRTQDVNLRTLALFLGGLGIDLAEARMVPDREDEIARAVNALRSRYTYVFTTGGIGPTHDDITADAIGKAFGLPVRHDPQAMALLRGRYAPGDFNAMRQRMARMPEGATLIRNPVSVAPGFQIANVFVLAGVPKIMEAMLADVAPRLQQGVAVESRSVTFLVPEGRIAATLADIQGRHPAVSIGSYPFFSEPDADRTALGRFGGTNIVLRGRDRNAVAAAEQEVLALRDAQGLEAVRPAPTS